MELLPSLLEELKAVCAGFPDMRGGRGGNIEMADFAAVLKLIVSEDVMRFSRFEGHLGGFCGLREI